MQVNEIVQEALLLPADAQLAIADLLYKNLGAADPEVDRLWGEEALRRLAAYDAGRSKTFSMDEVLGSD